MRKWLVLAVSGAALLVLAAMAYVPRAAMQDAVQDRGYTEVVIGGFAWRGCSPGDVIRRRWSGRDRQGRTLEGSVCRGLVGGWSTRVTGVAE